MQVFFKIQPSLYRRCGVLALIACMCMCYATITSAQTTTTYTYHKSLGKSGQQMKNPLRGYTMQAAHEDWNVIYCQPGQTITLNRNGKAFFSYARWYNYADDATMPDLTCSDAQYNTSNGLIRWATSNYEQNKADASYKYTGGVVYIACDQSSYFDGGPSELIFNEPTIEQRMIFEIRPASDMAEKVNASIDNNWLETYDIMAPTGQTIHIGPKYAFQGTEGKFPYPSYYYSNSQKIVNISVDQNFVSGTNSTTTVGDWKQTTSNKTETFYVCTEAYSVAGSSASTVTNTWNLNVADFSGGNQSGNTITGSHPNAELTWNFTRTKLNANTTFINPSSEQINSTPFVRFGSSNDKTAEHVVFKTKFPRKINIVSVEVYCRTSVDNKNNCHKISIKYDNTPVLSDALLENSPSWHSANASSSVDSIEIKFTAQKEKSALDVGTIKVQYTIPGQAAVTYSVGDMITTEPDAQNLSKWKKVVRTVSSNKWEKTDYVSAGKEGWIWLKDGLNLTDQNNKPSVSSGQYIKVDPVKSASTSTFQLLYSTGNSSTNTVYSNDTTVTREEIYEYSTKGWDTDSVTSKTEIKSDTIVTSSGSGGQIFHIAQFRVQYLDKEVVGPRAAEMSSFINNMELIAEQNFNFGYSAQNPLPTGTTQRFIPLPVEESTFGFYYGTADRVSGNMANCFYNEYSFVSNGYGWTTNDSLANHVGQGLATDATTGFALYADGSQKAGTVFTLDFGAEFCPGAKMFFTAWIGDQNKKSEKYTTGYPIFTFYVEGIDAEGNAHTLSTFTTGEFKQEKNNWHHIIFPLEFSENVDYERFKLRIVNVADTVTNNDFFIDDIRVFLQRASVAPIQASTPKNVCLNEQDKMVLYTRIDYKELEQYLPVGSRNFYYRWYDMDGNAITDTTYLNCQKSQKDNLPYGYVTVPTNMSNNPNIVSSFDQFDEIHHNSDTAVYAYIEEECLTPDNTPEKRYVAYIATPVPVLFGQNYRCVVTYSPTTLPDTADVIDLNDKCKEDDIVTTVNGLCIHSTQLGGFMADDSQASANISYRLALVSEGMVRNGALSRKEVTYYYAHWLYGRAPNEDDSESIKNAKLDSLQKLYGAPYQTVKRAIQAYIQNVTLGKADTLCTDDQKDLVDRLVQARLLKLSDIHTMSDTSYIVYPLLTVDSINYTAFPIQSIYGEESACKEPKAITLRFPKNEESGGGGSTTPTERNAICFVGPNETKNPPDFVLSQPRRFRIPENTSSQVVNIALTNSESTYTLEQAVLFETNNGNIDIKTQPFNRSNWLAEVGEVKGNTVTFNYLNDLPEGYSYTFRMDYMVQDQPNEGAAEVKSYNGEAYITFIVVPDTLYYAGTIGDAWNADSKWMRRNEKGEKVKAVAPLPNTKVIYPQGDYAVLKPSSSNQQQFELEENAQAFISYDINYEPYSCSEVYLPAQTAVVGQQYLKTSDTEVPRWTIELPVWANKWKMNAVPLQDVVLGDMFVPDNGEKDDNPFKVSPILQEVGKLAIDRITYSFYNSLYNSDVRQYNDKGGYANISSSTWSFATNELDKPVPAGYGWALGYDAGSSDANMSIRLPKPDTLYHYFRNDAWVDFSSKVIDRTNAGKPMFTPNSYGEMSITLTNNSPSEIFLFGNPTFAYIDLAELMNAYNNAVATHPIKIAGFYTTDLDKDSRYQLAAKTGGNSWVSSVQSAGSVSGTSALLPPTQAVFIRFENKYSTDVPSLDTLTLTLSTSMLCDSTRTYYGDGTVKHASANAPAAQPEQALYITASRPGFLSSAVIVEDTTVEAEIFMLDKAKTPFAIFTVGDNRALAINHLRGEQRIPLALFAAAQVEQPTICFDGDPGYVMKWDLIDVKTGVREPLIAGRTMTLNLPQDGEVRYYLERTQRESIIMGDTTIAFRYFAYYGHLTLYSEEPLYDLRVYDPAGRLIAASADAGNSFSIALPAGTYIVRASGSTAKVIVH